ncbi:MAG: hypothetical protein ABIQ41_04115 [Gemmatimonadales bacterium]
MADAQYDLAYMPYLSMHHVPEFVFGRARVWNLDVSAECIFDTALRDRVRALLGMHRRPSRQPTQTRALAGIGVLAVGDADQRHLTPVENRGILALQRALFLCCLSRNARLRGPNAGHAVVTAENFDIIRQTFTLTSEYVSEQVGVIVNMNQMGYKIANSVFIAPAHVHLPLQCHWDEHLHAELQALSRTDRRLQRKILAAAEVMRASYYNSHNLDITARVLLQAAAFEVLFDLPEKFPRLAFKDTVERLLNRPHERRLRFKYEVFGRLKEEQRSVKGMWADRFYTLRNHLVHGHLVRNTEFKFRGLQHHLAIAPMVFTVAIKKLIDESRAQRGQAPVCDVFLHWNRASDRRHDEDDPPGFSVDSDWHGIHTRATSGRRRRR